MLNEPNVEYNEPVVITVLWMLLIVELVEIKLVAVALLETRFVEVTFVLTSDVVVKFVTTPLDTVKLVALINPVLMDVVANKLVAVILVPNKEPVVKLSVILVPPETSNVKAGAVVPIPTLPLV